MGSHSPRATIVSAEVLRTATGPAGRVILWIEPELVHQLYKGQRIELVLSPGPASPPPSQQPARVAPPASAASCQAPAEATGGAAQPAPSSSLQWSEHEAGDFKASCRRRGLDPEAVADLCELRGMPRPRRQTPEQRAGVLRRLGTEEGRAAYAPVGEARQQLVKAAQALTVAERKTAATAAGLTETAPKDLSSRELWQLLAAAGPCCTGGRPSQSLPVDRCSSCKAPIVWIVSAKNGKPTPCDPEIITGSPRGQANAPRCSLMLDDGTVRTVARDPDGLIKGRLTHFGSCPNAAQHRKTRKKEPAA